MKQRYTQLNKNKWFQYFIIGIAAILFTISIQVFILVAHTLTTGLSAIALIPSFIFEDFAPYITIMYLILNIPIIIYYWKKVKKDFLYKTTYYLVIQAMAGVIFIFDAPKELLTSLVVEPDQVYQLVWPIFILAGVGGVAGGFSVGIAWKYGGSSGGSDIIAHHFSQKHKRSVGSTIFLTSLFFMLISFAFNLSFSEDADKYWLPILVSTLLYMVINAILVSIIHPKYSAISLEVHSKKTDEISKYLKDSGYIHSWQVMNGTSGYTGAKIKILKTTMLLLELREFKKILLGIDKDAWFAVIRVRSVFGKFNTIMVE